jgi:hypothetical protein
MGRVKSTNAATEDDAAAADKRRMEREVEAKAKCE